MKTEINPPSGSAPRLGYAILYVNDVRTSLAFYEKAFGLTVNFASDEYSDLNAGGARIGFCHLKLARELVKQEVVAAEAGKPPLGAEIALVTSDVPALFERATQAGAVAVLAPVSKPWGQTVAYVRDLNGFLVELCTPLP